MEYEHVFSLLNNPTLVGNYPSLVCNFLSFSATRGSQRFHGSRHAFYVLDRVAVTEGAKTAIGLPIAHLYERPHPDRLQNRED
jgi:hypothetical protein